MFGVFNNRKEEKDNSKHPDYLELVEKWEAFLQKIEMRFNESLVNAEEAISDNLVESDFDITPTQRAWQGIKTQLMGLSDKVDQVFDETVEPQMLNYVESWELLDESRKGTVLRESILERIDRFQIVIEGKVAERFYNHAIQFLNEDFNCTQCSAKLEIKKDIFRSHYVSCDYCNTVNTFKPNHKISQISWVINDMAKYRAINEWDELQEAINTYNELPSKASHEDQSELITAFKLREEKERAYWSKYLVERYSLRPEYEETFDHDLEVKMKYLYEQRKREFNF